MPSIRVSADDIQAPQPPPPLTQGALAPIREALVEMDKNPPQNGLPAGLTTARGAPTGHAQHAPPGIGSHGGRTVVAPALSRDVYLDLQRRASARVDPKEEDDSRRAREEHYIRHSRRLSEQVRIGPPGNAVSSPVDLHIQACQPLLRLSEQVRTGSLSRQAPQPSLTHSSHPSRCALARLDGAVRERSHLRSLQCLLDRG